jgi:hypothetical protein
MKGSGTRREGNVKIIMSIESDHSRCHALPITAVHRRSPEHLASSPQCMPLPWPLLISG